MPDGPAAGPRLDSALLALSSGCICGALLAHNLIHQPSRTAWDRWANLDLWTFAPVGGLKRSMRGLNEQLSLSPQRWFDSTYSGVGLGVMGSSSPLISDLLSS